MRFTDNAELTAANMTNTDILAGTDVSEQTDKKFSLAGLADWFLNRFTGLSLAGKNQSVKAALDELNSTYEDATVASGQTVYTSTATQIYKAGKVVCIKLEGTLVGDSASWTTILTGVPRSYGGRNIPFNIINNAGGKVRVRVSGTNVQVAFAASSAGAIGTCITYVTD